MRESGAASRRPPELRRRYAFIDASAAQEDDRGVYRSVSLAKAPSPVRPQQRQFSVAGNRRKAQLLKAEGTRFRTKGTGKKHLPRVGLPLGCVQDRVPVGSKPSGPHVPSLKGELAKAGFPIPRPPNKQNRRRQRHRPRKFRAQPPGRGSNRFEPLPDRKSTRLNSSH